MDMRLSPKLGFFAVERSVRRVQGRESPGSAISSPRETAQPI
jgi:hypothetical protein